VVDVIDLSLGITRSQAQEIVHRMDEVLRRQRHLVLTHLLPKLPVQAEAADATEAVARGVAELLVEERPCLLQLGRVAGTESLIDPHQRLLVTPGGVFAKTVQEQEIAGLTVDDLDLAEVGLRDLLDLLFGELLATTNADLLRFAIDDVAPHERAV